jgi:protein-S-isoprenylcysteine O-methyltransferase Ste14
MKSDNHKTKKIFKRFIIRVLGAILIFGLMFFLPARTLDYWEAWAYLGIMSVIVTVAVVLFLRHDPDLLERRMRTKEKVKEQKLIIRFSWILFIPIFLIPGFDKYYGWSGVLAVVVIISDILIICGYCVIVRVFRENSFASRVVEIETDQKVISTGPYAVVRHPMYSGVLLMYGITPVALGSYWAMISVIFLVVIIVARIFSEEKYLAENLEGYKEYLEKTRYRIIPGIW